MKFKKRKIEKSRIQLRISLEMFTRRVHPLVYMFYPCRVHIEFVVHPFEIINSYQLRTFKVSQSVPYHAPQFSLKFTKFINIRGHRIKIIDGVVHTRLSFPILQDLLASIKSNQTLIFKINTIIFFFYTLLQFYVFDKYLLN